jgi:hypothetical protein
MSQTELETVARGDEWDESAFRDAGAATFGCAESFDYDSLVFALVRGVPDDES